MWLLLCYLRMSPAGCDRDIVASHFHARPSVNVKVQKWQDAVRHQLSILDAQDRLPACRTSRAAGWIQATEKMRQERIPELPSALTMHSGQVVAVYWKSEVHLATVLSVWRHYRKGCGSQLVQREVSRGAVHSARVALMRQVLEGHENIFQCDSSSIFLVIPSHAIGLRFDTEKMHQKAAVDGRKIQLDDATWYVSGIWWDMV